jgi:ABC-type antimicrobial peptide transport system ATPase subunit
MDISPVPTDEEAAAIVAAIDATWPRQAGAPVVEATPRWRFSGRWWTKPIPTRRERPW